LLRGQASFARFTAALPSGTRQAGSLALERFQNKGLVGLDDPGEFAGFVERWRRKKSVAPAECRGDGDAATFRRLDQAFSGDQSLCLRPANVLSCADEPKVFPSAR
jgi:hypothetical protein